VSATPIVTEDERKVEALVTVARGWARAARWSLKRLDATEPLLRKDFADILSGKLKP